MKILVCVKRVVDYNVRIRVKADESGVELANIKMAMNPFDDIAVEEAIRLKEKGSGNEIIVAAIGAEAVQEQLRTALAMGADRAMRIACDTEVDSLGAAKLYAALARREEPGLILLGKQAIDDDACACGQMLAALLGWPQGTFASKIAVENGGVTVTREVDDGLVTLSLALPAVVTADLRLNEPRYPSLPNIMKAKSKPLTVVTAEELASGNIAPRLSIVKTQAPPKRQAGIRVKDTAELVEKLKAAGVV